MNERENLISLLTRQGFDHVPVEFNLCPHLVDVYKEKTNSKKSYQKYFNMPWEGVGSFVRHDFNAQRFNKYHTQEDLKDPNFSLDSDGVGHRKTPTSMHMTQMIHPLENADSIEQIQEYPLEHFNEKLSTALTKLQVKAVHAKGLAALGNMQCTVWESAWYMRGMENLMMDMMCDEKMAECMLDKATERSLSRAKIFAKAGVDILFLGDDIGMQNSIMMSEELYCTWLKPRLAKIISAAKQINPNTQGCPLHHSFLCHMYF